MFDTYVECMVARKKNPLLQAARYVLIGLCALCVVAMFCTVSLAVVCMLLAIGFGVAAYFVNMAANVEYEYLYIDKEIVVDKVLNKAKRKRLATYDLEKVEIMAPMKSYHLDDYKNRTPKVVDVSSGIPAYESKRYVFYYDGQQKIIFEPSAEMLKAMKNVAPRKIFLD